MLKKTVFRLNFLSPLHIGKGLGETYDTSGKTLHSDTISGLLASMWSMKNGGKGVYEFMESYRVSSAFPFYKHLFFLPVPLSDHLFQIKDIESGKAGKLLKKIEFLPVSLWETISSGQPLEIRKDELSSCGRFLFPGEEKPISLFKDELEQRVSVSRGGEQDSAPFYFDRRFFSRDCGLYFFFEGSSQITNEVEKLLEIAGTVGVGTDKSVGNGQFTVKRDTITFKEDDLSSHKYQLLSLYCPLREELEGVPMEKNDYQLIKRGGFIAGTTNNKFRHLRKKSLYMFTEGSLFRTHKPKGKIENVRPQWNDESLHPVFRDGRAFYLPVKI